MTNSFYSLRAAVAPTDSVEVSHLIIGMLNLKVAKALGLTIALEVLYRADRIIR
jgi:hypothetical protein